MIEVPTMRTSTDSYNAQVKALLMLLAAEFVYDAQLHYGSRDLGEVSSLPKGFNRKLRRECRLDN